MITLVAGVALALPPLQLRVPFPTKPLFEGEQRLCVNVDGDLGIAPIEVDDGRFAVSCHSEAGRTEACMTVLADTQWPSRVPTLICPGTVRDLAITPVLAFDPTENVWDGVEILRRVAVHEAAFRVPDVPDLDGIIARGKCGVSDGYLWMKLREEPRRQVCTLVFPSGEERQVGIALVGRLQATR